MSKTLNDLLRELELAGFYGSVELRYENGRITIARKAETIKLIDSRPNYSRNNRGTHAEHNT
jgi:hypothetical protein